MYVEVQALCGRVNVTTDGQDGIKKSELAIQAASWFRLIFCSPAADLKFTWRGVGTAA